MEIILKRGTCLSFPPTSVCNVSTVQTIRLEIRSGFTIHYLLIHGVWAQQSCIAPVTVEGSLEGLSSRDALPQQNHQGGQKVHLTSSAWSREGVSVDLCIRCSWCCGLWGCSYHRQREKGLPFLWILLNLLWVLSFLAWGGREKEGMKSHLATYLAMLLNKLPARAGFP